MLMYYHAITGYRHDANNVSRDTDVTSTANIPTDVMVIGCDCNAVSTYSTPLMGSQPDSRPPRSIMTTPPITCLRGTLDCVVDHSNDEPETRAGFSSGALCYDDCSDDEQSAEEVAVHICRPQSERQATSFFTGRVYTIVSRSAHGVDPFPSWLGVTDTQRPFLVLSMIGATSAIIVTQIIFDLYYLIILKTNPLSN